MKTVLMILASIVTLNASASVYFLNGKEVTKGQALIAKAKDEKAVVTKVDTMEISDKGTLKAIKNK